jgi:SAM-dependent methyltransferase
LAKADCVLERERAYHDKLYSGEAQLLFARPAVRAFRQHLATRILRATGAGASSRVLSLGCGIGDTELLLAPHVGQVVGVDVSPAAVRQARADAQRMRVSNATFIEGTAPLPGDPFDAVIAVFLLHHLPDDVLSELPGRILELLKPGGVFCCLDPSVRRLSGAVGRLLVPQLMKKYQSPDERELDLDATADLFQSAGFVVQRGLYDFGSTPLAGLFPGWRMGYRMARRADDLILRLPVLRGRGSNFEIVARKP